MLDFARTAMGRAFFERDVPRIADALQRLAAAAERLAMGEAADPEREANGAPTVAGGAARVGE